jgi:ubiquinone/menaquinone biosynthesis C-methylase UbiE
MNHADHVNLLRGGIIAGDDDGNWADFGSGAGAFTLALADLLGDSATIYSVDRDSAALKLQRSVMRTQFPDRDVQYTTADFTQALVLPPLDGVVMANSLHFVQHKAPVLALVHGYLKPGGRLILVEYNTDSGNQWVPYPLAFETWRVLAGDNGFRDTRLLSQRPSRFLGEIYSAVSIT